MVNNSRSNSNDEIYVMVNSKSRSSNEIYFTLAALHNFNGVKPFKVNSIVKLKKDYENKYDSEAICVDLRYAGTSAYVANSVHSVAKGTMSAGRLYDKILDEDYGKVKFIFDDLIICRLLTSKEIDEELANPDSDINYI